LNTLLIAVLLGIAAKWLAQLRLEQLNRKHVLAHSREVPPAFREVVEPAIYAKSVDYTLTKSRLRSLELTFDTTLLCVVLASGVLPSTLRAFQGQFGNSATAMAAWLFAVGFALSVFSLPWDWYAQFRLEAKFGFNTSTTKVWWTDRLKGLLLGLVIGFPLLLAVLKIVERAGPNWWFWAWALLLAFQLVMSVLAPVLILPLFNKFSPLPEGGLRERLLDLAGRTGFRAASIQVMDGSKRSRHSNAFFTGFGRFRKIVLFDTLIEQLQESELEAVLAHEIGHYKRRHIPKMLAASAIGSLVGFYLISVLARQDWFFRAFGFAPGNLVVALLLFGLLAGIVSFWFSPIAHWWSRRYEYEADGFAAQAMNGAGFLIGALRKLNEKNLSNLTPHPVYSGFYYSHPTLLEREQALRAQVSG